MTFLKTHRSLLVATTAAAACLAVVTPAFAMTDINVAVDYRPPQLAASLNDQDAPALTVDVTDDGEKTVLKISDGMTNGGLRHYMSMGTVNEDANLMATDSGLILSADYDSSATINLAYASSTHDAGERHFTLTSDTDGAIDSLTVAYEATEDDATRNHGLDVNAKATVTDDAVLAKNAGYRNAEAPFDLATATTGQVYVFGEASDGNTGLLSAANAKTEDALLATDVTQDGPLGSDIIRLAKTAGSNVVGGIKTTALNIGGALNSIAATSVPARMAA